MKNYVYLVLICLFLITTMFFAMVGMTHVMRQDLISESPECEKGEYPFCVGKGKSSCTCLKNPPYHYEVISEEEEGDMCPTYVIVKTYLNSLREIVDVMEVGEECRWRQGIDADGYYQIYGGGEVYKIIGDDGDMLAIFVNKLRGFPYFALVGVTIDDVVECP